MKNFDKLLKLCIEDLARKLELDTSNVDVVVANPALWPDHSMGCPEAGMFYPQTPLEGYRIVLSANNKRYQYHTDTESRVKQFMMLYG
jgi:hypothetical protein